MNHETRTLLLIAGGVVLALALASIAGAFGEIFDAFGTHPLGGWTSIPIDERALIVGVMVLGLLIVLGLVTALWYLVRLVIRLLIRER